MNAATTPVQSRGVQLRIDGIKGYGLPLDPVVLAGLDPFEVAHICMCLRLDPEQEACVEEAIQAVREGRYPAPRQGRRRR